MSYQYDLLSPTLTPNHINLVLSTSSEYTVQSTSNFITHIKGNNMPNIFKLLSFDVTSLFTKVPLDFTIDVILRQIYNKNEVSTNIPKQQMRYILLLCTKNVHFS